MTCVQYLTTISRVHTLFQKQNSRIFPGLFQDSNWFFKGSKIYINSRNPKISIFILLIAFHTLHLFWLSSTYFQNFPGPVAFFQDLCHNKIPGLSRFSRSRTSPACCICLITDLLRLLFPVVFLVFYCCDGFKFFQYCKAQWVVDNSEWSICSYDEESTHQWEDRMQPRDIMIKEPDFTLFTRRSPHYAG